MFSGKVVLKICYHSLWQGGCLQNDKTFTEILFMVKLIYLSVWLFGGSAAKTMYWMCEDRMNISD